MSRDMQLWGGIVLAICVVMLAGSVHADETADWELEARLPGDANIDGDVDVWQFDGGGDAQILSSNLGTMTGATWSDGDFNGDGDVDVWQFDGHGDAQLLSSNLGAVRPLEMAVPEPTGLLVWSVLGTLSLAYGWRRRKAA